MKPLNYLVIDIANDVSKRDFVIKMLSTERLLTYCNNFRLDISMCDNKTLNDKHFTSDHNPLHKFLEESRSKWKTKLAALGKKCISVGLRLPEENFILLSDFQKHDLTYYEQCFKDFPDHVKVSVIGIDLTKDAENVAKRISKNNPLVKVNCVCITKFDEDIINKCLSDLYEYFKHD
jgi:SepF-like predicted cell division protein (DUF552 family)